MKSKTYRVSNMSCHGCKATVEQRLLGSTSIEFAEVDLFEHTVTIRSNEELTKEDLQSILGDDSHYKFQ